MTTPNKYQGNGKRWPNGTVWMNWIMVNGEWQRLDLKKGLSEDQKAANEAAAKVPEESKVDWAGFALFILLLVTALGLGGLSWWRLAHIM